MRVRHFTMEPTAPDPRRARHDHDPALLMRIRRSVHRKNESHRLAQWRVIRCIEGMLSDHRGQLVNQRIIGVHRDSAKLHAKSSQRQAASQESSCHIKGARTFEVHENHTPYWSVGIRTMP